MLSVVTVPSPSIRTTVRDGGLPSRPCHTTRAQSVWREGLLLDSEDETLRETMKRFKVAP